MTIATLLTMSPMLMADSSGAIEAMRGYVTPAMQTLIALAALASTLFIVYGGFLYMSSRGDPEKLDQAKRVLKNALIGLVIILGAGALTAILTGAINHPAPPSSATLPNLEAITPAEPSNGLEEVLLQVITGFLTNLIQTISTPFLTALDFFTRSTPLMTENSTVFNFWLAMVGVVNVLFVLVVALIGFHVMSASVFGLDEVEFKQLLPRIALIFLLLNASIFIIDGMIALSNVLVKAISLIGGSQSIWTVLTTVAEESGGQGIAALLIMAAFLIFSFILLIYYVGRLVTLFVGTVLSPIVLLVWLIPGFRDFSETAIKTYIATIFILFVHVVILQLAASLFAGMSVTTGSDTPNMLMAMVVGLAAVIALLKTQGLMMQFSYVSIGVRSAKQLGTTFMNGVGYLSGSPRGAVSTAATGYAKNKAVATKAGSAKNTASGTNRGTTTSASYTRPRTQGDYWSAANSPPRQKTGTTYPAPNNSSTSRQAIKDTVIEKDKKS